MKYERMLSLVNKKKIFHLDCEACGIVYSVVIVSGKQTELAVRVNKAATIENRVLRLKALAKRRKTVHLKGKKR